MQVQKKDLADWYAVDIKTISNWESKGMPVAFKAGKGKPTIYDSKSVHDWLIAEQIDKLVQGDDSKNMVSVEYKKASTDKIRVATDRDRLRLLKERSELYHREEIEGAWSEILLFLRTAILDIPNRSAMDLVNIDSAAEVAKILRRYVEESMRVLAQQPIYSNYSVELDEIEDLDTQNKAVKEVEVNDVEPE